MSKNKNIFLRSLSELKSVRCLALTALLIAVNLTLDLLGLSIKLPPNLRIGFGFLCNAAIGMLFGPAVGMLSGVCTDVLGYFAGNFTMGGYFPGYTLTAVVGGLLWGLWLYPRKISLPRAIGAKVSVNVICNICMNTFWLSLTGGKAMMALLPLRAVKNLVLLPVEIALLYFVMKAFLRIYHSLPGGAPSGEGETAKQGVSQ
ncbi:folate family ECF transporter S component [Butyricicoccus sp. Marseille-Q5471]|uniref:folate family ECF transporter S component n=1 Tax=Butyricicoccus sp. Marseille-Q5471 TaxID=3039493 RepID=UPI0024BC86B6|nr:folate family ECF transporter S component [Butyricicoccus sp. Marseille-Q5471]